MKKFLIILVFVQLIISCKPDKKETDQSVILSGKISHAPTDKFVLKNVFYKKIADIDLDSNKSFVDTLNLKEGYYQFGDGKQYTWLYLKPGKPLKINVDYDDFDKSLTYQGENSKVNDYLSKYILKGIALKPKTSYKYYGKLDEKQFIKLFDSVENEYVKLLDKLDDETFVNLEKKKLQLDKLYYYLQYPMVRRYITKNDAFKVSDNFFDALQTIDINRPDYAKVPGYTRFVEAYLQDKLSQEQGKGDYDPLQMMEATDKYISNPSAKEQLAYQNARYNLLYTKDLNSFYQLFNTIVKDSIYKNEIAEKYNALKALERGSPSPDFTVYDKAGKEYHLKDFKGKPLYIDLWATWCSPCIAEIPYLDKIKNTYQNKPITFLSIDVYDDKKKWEVFLEKRKLTGWQLISTDREMNFLKKYVVDGIPRFILIDKDGKIIDANAPRPSEPELIKLLDKTLQEK